ncbi:MAG: hypothetical protein IIW31_00950 [Clostridia bacterium]|nr:hypothetical protein [Clostridia bacterium]
MRALRVVFLAVLCLCLFCACGELSPLDPDHAPDYVDKSVLIALLDELDSIPKTLDQTTVVNAYAAVRDSSSVSQKDVDAAVAVLKELRETILSSTVAFIDSGIARHVREALNKSSSDPVTVRECFALTELDCTYREGVDTRIRVAYDLRYFPNLTSLRMDGNALKTLDGFIYLKKLEILSLAGNPVCGVPLASNGAVEPASLSVLGKMPLKYLDVSCDEVSLSVYRLPSLPNLTYLNVSGATIVSLNGVGSLFPKLESFIASRASITDASDLAACKNLTLLNFTDSFVPDLTFLRAMESLSTLLLDGVQISDPSCLTGLAPLDLLSCSGCGITEISWLAGVTSATEIDLSHNKIKAIPADASVAYQIYSLDLSENSLSKEFVMRSNLALVCILDLSGNNLTSVKLLNDGPHSLIELDLSDNPKLASFDPGFTDGTLNTLDCSGCAFKTFRLTLPGLKTLVLSDNPITKLFLDLPDLTSLEANISATFRGNISFALPSLRSLTMTEKFTCSVDLLENMPCLESIAIHMSGVKEESLVKLTTLTDVSLYAADETELSVISALPNLKNLKVCSTASVKAPVLNGLTTLESLTFDGCSALKDLSGITDLPALTHLTVIGGSLSEPVLAGLPQLISLTLSDCDLSDLSGISSLESLTFLSVEKNGLQNVVIPDLPRLNYLDLHGNALPSYNSAIFSMTVGTVDVSGNPDSIYSSICTYPETITVINQR